MTRLIAEIGVNHMGNVEVARQLIVDAANGGAWGVKFQLYEPGLLDARAYVRERLRKWMLTKRELLALRRLAGAEGLAFGASCFDNPSVELLRSLKPDFQKTACGQAWPGMKRLNVTQFQSYTRHLADEIVPGTIPLLCVPEYPADFMSYLPIPRWARGISDHCPKELGTGAPLARGLDYVEVHIYNSMDAPDWKCSIWSKKIRDYINLLAIPGPILPEKRTRVVLKHPIKGQKIAWLRGVE